LPGVRPETKSEFTLTNIDQLGLRTYHLPHPFL
jgi:hypothetical protein